MGLGVWIEIIKVNEDGQQQIKETRMGKWWRRQDWTSKSLEYRWDDTEESEGKWVKGAEGGERKNFEMVISLK